MTDDLVKRLRDFDPHMMHEWEVTDEAADRISALTEEIGQLQARVEDQAREIADLTRQLQGQPRRPQDAGAAQKGAKP